MESLKKFRKIVAKQAPYLIIEQLMTLIEENHLIPGEKLPSEADLQKVLQLSRSQIHDAITLLERNGILISKPQSGTFLRDFGKHILITLMKDILDSRDDLNPEKLMGMRIVLEKIGIREAAIQADSWMIRELWALHQDYQIHRQSRDEAIDDDLYIHYRILEMSGNQVLKSQYCNLIPDIIFLTRKMEERLGIENRIEETYAEHESIIKALEARDPDKAESDLSYHLNRVLENYLKLGELSRE